MGGGQLCSVLRHQMHSVRIATMSRPTGWRVSVVTG